jgi:hypothetical protein
MMVCVDAAAGERMLEELPGAGSSWSLEETRHLSACETCRVSVERMRRIARTWRSIEPSARELTAARARFVARYRRRPRRRALAWALGVAIVLAAAVALAGARVIALRAAAHRVTVVAPDDTRSLPATAIPRPAPLSIAVSSQEAPQPPPPEATATLTVEVESLPRAPATIQVAPSAAVAAASAGSSEVGTSASGWAAAAEAMRTGDLPGAETAFGELTRSPDPRTRDEARLARAQVWMAAGRVSEARPELESLATTGATPLVRARAAEALRGAQRGSSKPTASGTNSP